MEITVLNNLSFIEMTLLVLLIAIICSGIIACLIMQTLILKVLNKKKEIKPRIKYLAKIDNEKMTHPYLARLNDGFVVCNKADKHLAATFDSIIEAISAGIEYNPEHAWVAEEVLP